MGKCKDHLGNEYNSITAMCSAYNINPGTFNDRIKSGWILSDALTTPLVKQRIWTQEAIEILKEKYPEQGVEIPELRDKYTSDNIHRKARHLKIKRLGQPNKWTKKEEEILKEKYSELGTNIPELIETHNRKSIRIHANRMGLNKVEKCKDHKGNEYSSALSMCKAHNINYMVYKNRIDKGYSLEDALTLPADGVAIKSTDHLGNEYKSVTEMCCAYNIKISAFYTRLCNGWSLKDALTVPMNEKRSESLVYDHLGNEFRSQAAMCRHYGIRPSAFERRIKVGYTLEEALTKVVRKQKRVAPKPATDHLGKEFSSENQMCKYYNVGHGVFKERIAKGWTLENALTYKSKKFAKNHNFELEYLTTTKEKAIYKCKCLICGLEEALYEDEIKKHYMMHQKDKL